MLENEALINIDSLAGGAIMAYDSPTPPTQEYQSNL